MKFFHPGYAILFSTLLLVFAVYTLQRRSEIYSHTRDPELEVKGGSHKNDSGARGYLEISDIENQSTTPEPVPATPTPRVTVKGVENLDQFLKIIQGHGAHVTQSCFIKKDTIISIETFECGGGCVKITTNELTLHKDTHANKIYNLPFESMKEANNIATHLIRYIQGEQANK